MPGVSPWLPLGSAHFNHTLHALKVFNIIFFNFDLFSSLRMFVAPSGVSPFVGEGGGCGSLAWFRGLTEDPV